MRTTWNLGNARQKSLCPRESRSGSGNVSDIARADQSRRLSNSVDAREGNGAMIVSRTPLRMSFVGGGTDLPSYYTRESGAVISTSIDKYVYITVNRRFDQTLRVSYSQTEIADCVDAIRHPIFREAMRKTGRSEE